MSDYFFDGQGLENFSAPPSVPPSLNSSSVEAPSAVHRNFRMSSLARRLPVILFVSRIEILIVLLISVARSAWCGRRRSLHCMRHIASHCHLRLVHGLLLLLLLLPPPCPLRNPLRTRILFADYSFECYSSYLSCVHSFKVRCPYGLCYQPSLPQVTSQVRLEPDVLDPHPGSTAGYHHQSQALGGPDRSPAVPYDVPL